MAKKTILYFFLVNLISCSSMTLNLVQEGEFELSSGQHNEKAWDSSINFQRVSWFSELTLLFDLFYINSEKLGDFNQWLSPTDQNSLSLCEKSFVALVYDLDERRYAKATFYESLRDQGVEVQELQGFKEHISLHPDFQELSFNLYDIKLLCFKGEKSEVLIQVPSYQEVRIK